jgi:MIP family channel proteins
MRGYYPTATWWPPRPPLGYRPRVESTRAAIAELVATFALVFVGAGASITSGFGLDLTGVGLAHGLVLAAMIASTAHLGGGFANPAVSIGLWVAGRLTTTRAAILVVAEVLGAVAAGFLLRYLVPDSAFTSASGGTPLISSAIPAGKAIVIEAVCTFFLVFAIFALMVERRGPSRTGAAFSIGAVYAFCIMAFGPFTGSAMNPARWLGPALASGAWSDWYVWLVGPVSGGIIAAVLYSAVFVRDRSPATP